MLEKANAENEEDKETERKVAQQWDHQFGHCFPNLMEGIETGPAPHLPAVQEVRTHKTDEEMIRSLFSASDVDQDGVRSPVSLFSVLNGCTSISTILNSRLWWTARASKDSQSCLLRCSLWCEQCAHAGALTNSQVCRALEADPSVGLNEADLSMAYSEYGGIP